MEPYKILSKAKRGFLIIGLSGYTGSGFSQIVTLLRKKKKPNFPDLQDMQDVIEEYKNIPEDDRFFTSISSLLTNIKLKQAWDEFDWESFRYINISAVIVAKGIIEHHDGEKLDVFTPIEEQITSDSQHISGLKLLFQGPPVAPDDNKAIIAGYQYALGLTRLLRDSIRLPDYIEILKTYGNNIRRCGLPSGKGENDIELNINTIPNAINHLIKCYRKIDKENKYFVIDAFRVPHEVEYFRRRYNEFYLFVTTRNNEQRLKALKKLGFTDIELNKLKKDEGDKEITDSQKLTEQYINGCTQKGDFFINLYSPEHKKIIRYNLIKFLCLFFKPGCVPPSTDERCMQIAMTARHMSGCISRQVGATVANSRGWIQGIGWNDPPDGQIPCSLRIKDSTGQIITDELMCKIFSDYERSDEFATHIQETIPEKYPFCFREELSELEAFKDEKKPGEEVTRFKKNEFTRALHAEENALFQATRNNSSLLKNAVLYATASTCTLCAKKAYHLGVKRIVYIEEYPGIALEQTLKVGFREIKLDRFTGITSSAYFKLFTPMLPEKELLKYEKENLKTREKSDD